MVQVFLSEHYFYTNDPRHFGFAYNLSDAVDDASELLLTSAKLKSGAKATSGKDRMRKKRVSRVIKLNQFINEFFIFNAFFSLFFATIVNKFSARKKARKFGMKFGLLSLKILSVP